MAEMRIRSWVLATMLALSHLACGAPRSRDSASPGSRTVIQNKGSDSLVNVAQNWAEVYSEIHPSVAVAVSGGGTGTGIAALINGTADIANASRLMDDKEIELASSRGRTPFETTVGYDAVVVYVHKDNPLEEISLAQLAEIFGENGTSVRWDPLGVQVPGCKNQQLIVVSRQNNSGTYEYFRSVVLGSARDYRLGTYDLHGSKDVVDLVDRTPCAIGYSGLAFQTPKVKMLCVRPEGADHCVVPSVATAVDGSYVLSRPLVMYTAGEPEGEVKEYLDWILSDDGQCIIANKGYAPVRAIECTPS